MRFFFVPDKKNNFKFLCEETSEIRIKSSRWQKLWLKAKNTLTKPLPVKITAQEKAFAQLLSIENENIEIFYPEIISNKKIKIKFRLFLYKERTKHIIRLIAGLVLFPISWLITPIPGPNILFWALVIILILNWQALKGIRKLIKREYQLTPSSILGEWYQMIKQKSNSNINNILKKIEKEYKLKNLVKIL